LLRKEEKRGSRWLRGDMHGKQAAVNPNKL
jgi:hypothetical protein